MGPLRVQKVLSTGITSDECLSKVIYGKLHIINNAKTSESDTLQWRQLLKLTIASGKGGTGKTTVAVNMVLSLAMSGMHPIYLDCDVEAPNAALFLHPLLTESLEVGQLIPEVDAALCTVCGRCAEVCEYHAITVIGQNVLVFPELCHGCGSCTLNCPSGAIHEVLDKTGFLERGSVISSSTAGGIEEITFAQGTLNIGEAQSVPVIRQLKRWAVSPDNQKCPVILDAPPGTSCPVVETMRSADAVLLVTEPTPFGLHDLRIAVDVARKELGLPVAVVINRDGIGDNGVDDFCERENIPVLLRIPFNRQIAEAYAEGVPLIDVLPQYQKVFLNLYLHLMTLSEKGDAV